MVKKKGETTEVRGAGDNNPEEPVSGEKLLGFISHLEKLDKKKDQVLQEIREVYASAKAVGYDGKIIRRLIKERKMEPEKLKEQLDLFDLYASAINHNPQE
jgi:uncharacterized protein (UPF0335 family)